MTTALLASELLVRRIHVGWAWVVVIGNGLAGLWCLAAHWLPSLRTRALWWYVIAVEVAIPIQVSLGVAVMKIDHIEPPQFHLFYGFVAFMVVGGMYAYYTTTPWLQQRKYLVYGLASLFLMGLGIRAILVGAR
jgi:hypothetical protein